MNQEHLNRLDFTNEALTKWLNDCPFDIWHLRQNWDKHEYTKEDPMGLHGTAKVFKAVDISIQIPVENCPINLRHWFKNNDALVKVEKDYRETYVLQEEAYKRWMAEKDPLAAREAEKSWNRYREQLQVLNEQLEKAEQKQ